VVQFALAGGPAPEGLLTLRTRKPEDSDGGAAVSCRPNTPDPEGQ
jgi:hypothetical protein